MDLLELGLKPIDAALAQGILGGSGVWRTDVPLRVEVRQPDLVIAPDGSPYIYRWHLIPRNEQGNVYFHIQVADDPERPLHDHPWDNTSVILAGGYNELMWREPPEGDPDFIKRVKGDVVHRKAEEAHRLLLLPRHHYSMSLFTTGPKRRDWGFWSDAGARPEWISHAKAIHNRADGTSVYVGPAR